MTTVQPSIWTSIEFFCISRDASHEDYLDVCITVGTTHQVFCKAAYQALRVAFNEQMHHDFNKE